jgi:hypothetical protein
VKVQAGFGWAQDHVRCLFLQLACSVFGLETLLIFTVVSHEKMGYLNACVMVQT